MPAVTVVNAAEVQPLVEDGGLSVRHTVGPATGFAALEQAVVECPPGGSASATVGDVEQTMFVLDGSGTLEVDGVAHELSAEVGAYLPPGSRYELRSDGDEPLRAVLVTVPDPVAGP
ncbi:MAG: cupin domain-containing protein, partial [Solirubrobacteraceae bacterium]